VRSLQPGAVIFSDVGPDIRWVGNEKGYAGETCWETFSPVGENGGPAAPGDVRTRESTSGTRNGANWMPPECDVSIRPGWFWQSDQNDKVKSPQELLDLYFKSVGRGGSLLLNIPPDRRGLLHENDVASLRTFGNLRGAMFRPNLAAGAKATASHARSGFGPQNLIDSDRYSYWSTDDGLTTPSVTFDLPARVSFSVVRLRENIRLGQRVEAFAVDAWNDGGWRTVAQATSVGNCRLVRTEEAVATSRVRLRITQSPVCPALSEFSLFG
jgi:alpha-L-fucosidase